MTLTLADIPLLHPAVVSPSTRLIDAIAQMSELSNAALADTPPLVAKPVAEQMCLCVMDNERLVGLLTAESILHRIARGRSLEGVVADAMVSSVPTVYIHDSICYAQSVMRSQSVQHLVVLSTDGDVMGVVQPLHVAQSLIYSPSLAHARLSASSSPDAHSALPDAIAQHQPAIAPPCIVIDCVNHGAIEKQPVDQLRQLNQELEQQVEKHTVELAESEARFRLFVEHAPAAVAMFDTEMRYIVISQRWLSDYGLAGLDIIGMKHEEVFPNMPDRWKATHQRCMAGATETCEEDAFLGLDGSLQWIKWEVRPWYNGCGAIGGIIMFTEAITKRKQAERDLRELTMAMQYAIAGIARLDKTGCYCSVNRTYAALCGYEPDELIGKTWQQTVHPDDVLTLEMAYQQTRELGRVELEARGWRKNQTPFFKQVTLVTAYDDLGLFNGFYCFLKDISDRKQAEAKILKALSREKELNELKSRFVSITSHEFRTPLTTILGSTELLEHSSHKWSEDKKKRYYQRIKSTVQHLTQLLDDVLLVNKVEQGDIHIQPCWLDLSTFCRGLVESQLHHRHLHCSIHFSAPPEPCQIYCDEKLMRQILNNLISNASKYSSKGQAIDVIIDTTPTHLTLKVQDWGLGIPATDLPRIFEPFHRGHNVGGITGTGLGLSIVKRAVMVHGGTIQIYSELGKGTLVTVYLPKQNHYNSSNLVECEDKCQLIHSNG